MWRVYTYIVGKCNLIIYTVLSDCGGGGPLHVAASPARICAHATMQKSQMNAPPWMAPMIFLTSVGPRPQNEQNGPSAIGHGWSG